MTRIRERAGRLAPPGAAALSLKRSEKGRIPVAAPVCRKVRRSQRRARGAACRTGAGMVMSPGASSGRADAADDRAVLADHDVEADERAEAEVVERAGLEGRDLVLE